MTTVVFTRDCGGLPVDAIGPVLGVPPNELLVIVRTEDKPEPEPVGDLNTGPDTPLKHEADDGGDVLRPTRGASAPPVDAVPTIRPTNVLGLPTLPEHGVSLGDLRAVASGVGCAVLITDAGLEIVGPVAPGVYRDVSAAALALNAARRIANPPESTSFLARRREVDAGRVRALPDDGPPPGVRTARQAEADLAPHRLEGESFEQCAARLQAEANASVPAVVLLHPRGATYTNTRLGDAGRFEE